MANFFDFNGGLEEESDDSFESSEEHDTDFLADLPKEPGFFKNQRGPSVILRIKDPQGQDFDISLDETLVRRIHKFIGLLIHQLWP